MGVVAVFLMDLRGKDCLPFTCCPMFAVPRNIFGDEVRGGILADFNLRDGGYVDFMYNFFPWNVFLPLDKEALSQMPGRVLLWMSTNHCHPLLQRLLKPECQGKDLLVCANFEVGEALWKKLEELVQTLEASKAQDWAGPAKM